jgi:hypothetical protein
MGLGHAHHAVIWREIMGQRPEHVKPPAHWAKATPAPEPDPIGTPASIAPEDEQALNPTRYGDWERKGIAVDF